MRSKRIDRRTGPALGFPARVEFDDGTRAAVKAALHADESQATVTVARGRRVCLIVITSGRSRVSGLITKIETTYNIHGDHFTTASVEDSGVTNIICENESHICSTRNDRTEICCLEKEQITDHEVEI